MTWLPLSLRFLIIFVTFSIFENYSRTRRTKLAQTTQDIRFPFKTSIQHFTPTRSEIFSDDVITYGIINSYLA